MENVFGKKKVDALQAAFKEADGDRDGKVHVDDLAFLLRSQGLAPTQKQVFEFSEEIKKEGGSFTFNRFLEIAVKCGRNEVKALDLIEFFAPYDPSNSGKISVKVFRNLMENVGEMFTRNEVDEIIKEFAVKDEIDYKNMLNIITLR